MVQNMNNNLQDELDEDLNIDLKKIVFAIWNRKRLIGIVRDDYKGLSQKDEKVLYIICRYLRSLHRYFR